MSGLKIYERMKANPGYEPALEDCCRGTVERVRSDPHTVAFGFYRDETTGHVVVVLELKRRPPETLRPPRGPQRAVWSPQCGLALYRPHIRTDCTTSRKTPPARGQRDLVKQGSESR